MAEALKRAIKAVGSQRILAKRLGVSQAAIAKWERVPEHQVFHVERVSGIDAEALRPDLTGWIRIERQRRALERARLRMGLASPLTGTARIRGPVSGERPVSTTIYDLGLIIAAVKWAAKERGFAPGAVLHATDQASQSARAYGLALAYVVCRVSSTVIGVTVGTSRQNIENCGARYLRARDGDDGDDWDDPEFSPSEAGYVIERGRRRRQKQGSEDLWARERAFLEWIEAGCE